MATHHFPPHLSGRRPWISDLGSGVARASRPWAVAAAAATLSAPSSPAESPLAPDPPTALPVLDITANPLDRDDPAFRPFVLPRDHADRAFATFKDALGAVPGLLLQESFGGFEPPRLSLRGSGLQSTPSSRGVQLLLNHFPLSLADGSFNTSLIDPQLFERAEVHRGSAAARLAPAALGGAISFRSPSDPRGTGILPVGALRAEASSFGGARLRFGGGAVHDHTAFQAAGSFSRFGGFRDRSEQERTAVFAQATQASPRACNTSVSVYHARARYEVPGPLTLAAATLTPRVTSADVQRDRPQRESSLTQVTAQTTQQSSVLRLDVGVSWLHNDDWFRQLRPLGISDSQSDDLTLRGVLTRRFEAGTGEHQLRIGTVLSRGWRDVDRYLNDSGTTGRLFAANGLFSSTASLDAEATVRLCEPFVLILGATGLFTRRDVSDSTRATSVSPGDLRTHADAVLPRAQLLWTPRPAVTFSAAVARSAEPPTFDELLAVTGSYPDLRLTLKPLATQRATTWEIGYSGTHGRIRWDLAAYHAAWTSEILRLADAQGLPRGAVNASSTRHSGLEAAGRWRVLEGAHQLDLAVVATWSRFSFAGDPVYRRNRIAGAPPLIGSVELDYRHHRGAFAVATLAFTVGTTPVDHANRLTYGGHALTHLRAGWRSPPSTNPRERSRWTYFVEVRNLFDRGHIASTTGVLDVARAPASTALFLPGAPRSFTVGLDWSH